MTTTAALFPGQGSQCPGMGRAFVGSWPAVDAELDRLDGAVDADLRRLCVDADADRLRATHNAQPAVFGLGWAVYAALGERAGLDPDYLAGHSLGHLTAAAAAGALDPAEGIELARRRGELMAAAAAEAGPGRMVAVLAADPETVAAACERREDVSVAAYNAPRQTVVSGTAEGVAAARERIGAATRARFVDLDVAAAFHSPVMAGAVEPFAALVGRTAFREAAVPLVSDRTGEVYTDPGTLRRDLPAQLTAPVDWVAVVETLRERGVQRYVELPPAGTLARLVDEIHPGAEVHAVEAPADAEVVA